MTLCTLSEYGNTNNSRKTFIASERASERATQVLRTFPSIAADDGVKETHIARTTTDRHGKICESIA